MKRPWPFHTLLLALYPVLFLYSRNQFDLTPTVIIRPALVSTAVSMLILVVLGWWLKNLRRAALYVSFGFMLFASYGHFLAFLVGHGPWQGLSVPRFLVLLGYLVLSLMVWLVTRYSEDDFAKLTSVLNVVSICLLAAPLFQTGSGLWHGRQTTTWKNEGGNSEVVLGLSKNTTALPSVFYIVLDAYGRHDKLEDLYGYDNSGFLDALRAEGFFIAETSRTNYCHTILSLASSLNYRYLNALSEQVGRDATTKAPLERMIAASAVRSFLEARGYRLATLQNGYSHTTIKDASIVLGPSQGSEFGQRLLGLTAGMSNVAERTRYQDLTLAAFANLPRLAAMPGPIFAFVHLEVPHPPFVFDHSGPDNTHPVLHGRLSANHLIAPDGLTRREYKERYVEQMRFVDSKTIATVKAMIAAAPVPPVIILQGDHGPGTFLHHDELTMTYLGDRSAILNAYYLGGGSDPALYDSISPVNSFRVVLNHYFDTQLELEPDRSFFAPASRPYDLVEITNLIDSPSDRQRLALLQSMDYFPDSASPSGFTDP